MAGIPRIWAEKDRPMLGENRRCDDHVMFRVRVRKCALGCKILPQSLGERSESSTLEVNMAWEWLTDPSIA